MNTKLKIPVAKPRNPLVAPALMRKAGPHQDSEKTRQGAKRDLQRQIKSLPKP